MLSQSLRQVVYALLTRSPVYYLSENKILLDLHVSSTPPAFVLSQDQTLRQDLVRQPEGLSNTIEEPLLHLNGVENYPKHSSWLELLQRCPWAPQPRGHARPGNSGQRSRRLARTTSPWWQPLQQSRATASSLSRTRLARRVYTTLAANDGLTPAQGGGFALVDNQRAMYGPARPRLKQKRE